MSSSMFNVNSSGMAKLGAQLRKTRPAVYKQVRRTALEQGERVAEDARSKADWSTRIPGTIKAGTRGAMTVVVRAGGAGAPHAAAYEHAGATGTFRHPVFPDASKGRDEWTWVSEAARPYLHPALLERMGEIIEAVGSAVVVAVDETLNRVR